MYWVGGMNKLALGALWKIHQLSLFLVTSLLLCNVDAVADDPVCDLSGASDPDLQQQLESLLEREQLSAAAERGELALTLLVLSDPERPRLAQVNGNRMIYAASLPKLVILLGAAVAIDEGRLILDDEVRRELHHMIRQSCNKCANRMIKRVGKQQLLEVVKSPRFGFYNEKEGGLWLGKQYGRDQAWQRDRIHGLSHGATSYQATRFFCGLQRGTLVSPEQNQLMLETLSNPGINHKFVQGLEVYEDVEIFRKSGTWKSWHADGALIRSGDAVYVIVGLAHNDEGGHWLKKLAAPLHELALASPENQATPEN